MDVVRTFKASGFTMTDNRTSSFQNMCLSKGKNSSQLSPQPSLGVIPGGKSVSDFIVTTLQLLIRGKANLSSIPKSCPCCAHFLTTIRAMSNGCSWNSTQYFVLAPAKQFNSCQQHYSMFV